MELLLSKGPFSQKSHIFHRPGWGRIAKDLLRGDERGIRSLNHGIMRSATKQIPNISKGEYQHNPSESPNRVTKWAHGIRKENLEFWQLRHKTDTPIGSC